MQASINIENLWVRIHEKLFSFILKHVKNEDHTHDIIQDTFIKVKTNINKLKNPAKVESWIFQIARNTLNDFFREQKKSFSNNEPIEEESVAPLVFANEEINVKIQSQEFSNYAGLVVNELPEKYRRAVQMADIEGLSMKEIAEELNISVSGAKSRVQRGRKMIKEIILKCCEVNTDKYGNIIDYTPYSCNSEENC